MKTHSLTIIASGLDPQAADFADRFFEAGCDDATIAVQKGLIVLEFDREARTFTSALMSALRDVASTGAKIVRVEPDYLVSAAEIARRCDLGRAAISLYAQGLRGRDFPHPVARFTSESPLFDWAEVASWLHAKGKISRVEVVQARMVRDVNRFVIQQQQDTSYFGRQLRAWSFRVAA